MNESKLLACLRILGIKPTMKTFRDRKRMQKVSYWLPIFGIDVGLNINSYSWYLHGPYSPGLTRTLFDIVEDPGRYVIGRLTKQDMDRIERLEVFLGEDVDSADSLELLSSLHFLLYHAERFGAPTDAAIEALKAKKPYFKDDEIQRALEKIRTIDF